MHGAQKKNYVDDEAQHRYHISTFVRLHPGAHGGMLDSWGQRLHYPLPLTKTEKDKYHTKDQKEKRTLLYKLIMGNHFANPLDKKQPSYIKGKETNYTLR